MELLRWLLGATLALVSLWLMAQNWIVFWRRHVRSEQASSWIPLLPGILGLAALTILSIQNLSRFWLIPLLIDWGSIPGLSYTIIRHLVRRGGGT